VISSRHLTAVYNGPGSSVVRGAGGVMTRGFLQVEPVGVSDGIGVVRQYLTTLRVRAGSLPYEAIDGTLTIATHTYRIVRLAEVFDDGAEELIELAGPL
jgi:hypothetical protein